ncbi:hypothetical protein IFM89_026586 [Coptis chinensis]|uniref:F-box associated beta-propeller type 3 domain-containing protein n=1 Tax=Coptis chinensis TaxID=261450 RepID=A0A835IRL2_9MAGN|nr:hypothetical protein IFM89_026586 [Coptis chinensis]
MVHSYNLRNTPPISGVFLHRTSILGNPEFEFISLDSTTKSAPFKSLIFVNDPVGIKILQSCNGLLCCSGSFRTNSKTYYIYNPNTKQYTLLPKACSVPGSNRGFICSVSLAFNPLKSPDYKVVCMHNIGSDDEDHQISIYSSNTSSRRFVGGTFTASGLIYLSGIYWNGALHFRTSEDCCLCFDVEKELFRTMPLPPIPVGREERRVDYLGASRDHLYLIQRVDYGNQLYILEMETETIMPQP